MHLRLDLPSSLFPSGFPTNDIYAFLFSRIHATFPDHLILFVIIILSIHGEVGALFIWVNKKNRTTITYSTHEGDEKYIHNFDR
jgi:hypothetical protein